MTQELKLLIGIGGITVAFLVGAIFLAGRGNRQAVSVPADTKLLVRDDSDKIATDSAKVTIVEFGDFQCPACGAAYPITKQILKDYSGRLNFVFRNFPLSQHSNALVSAEAAQAAGAQGKFWEMHDKLYENQDKWADQGNPLDIFVGYAKDLGLDVSKFKDDVAGNKFAAKITRDVSDGNTIGVNATPTFYINSEKIEGVPNLADFKAKIDNLIK